MFSERVNDYHQTENLVFKSAEKFTYGAVFEKVLRLKYKEQKEKKKKEGDEWSEAQRTVAQVQIMKLLEEKTQNVQQRVNTSFLFYFRSQDCEKNIFYCQSCVYWHGSTRWEMSGQYRSFYIVQYLCV